MAEPSANPSLVELLTSLAQDLPDLFRKEIRLAKAEARDALGFVIAALQRMALGSAFAIGAVGLLLAALVSGLSALLVATLHMEVALASTLAAAIVTILAALTAWILFASAMRSLRAAQASLDDTVNVIAASAANVAEKF